MQRARRHGIRSRDINPDIFVLMNGAGLLNLYFVLVGSPALNAGLGGNSPTVVG
jgi:hypothetical protein